METKQNTEGVVLCQAKPNVSECTRWQYDCRCEDCPYVKEADHD